MLLIHTRMAESAPREERTSNALAAIETRMQVIKHAIVQLISIHKCISNKIARYISHCRFAFAAFTDPAISVIILSRPRLGCLEAATTAIGMAATMTTIVATALGPLLCNLAQLVPGLSLAARQCLTAPPLAQTAPLF
jgi:hypothetical protein